MKFREKEFILSCARNMAYAIACGNYKLDVDHKDGILTEEETIEVVASIISSTNREPEIEKMRYKSIDNKNGFRVKI